MRQSHPLAPVPPVSWRFSPLPTRIFGLLPDACSSESSDIELEHKQGLQQIEEERKLREQQQYEDYRSFLEEQKHQFYVQQEAQQLYEQEGFTNEYIHEQCHQNGRFQKCQQYHLNEYDQEQHRVQSEFVQKHDVNGCVQEHEIYKLNGYLEEQSQHIEEYQLKNDADDYQYAGHHNVRGGEGCPQQPEQCYSTDTKEDVPSGQISCPEEQLVGQQGADEGGRLFCIVGPTGNTRLSTYAAMSSVQSTEGEYKA